MRRAKLLQRLTLFTLTIYLITTFIYQGDSLSALDPKHISASQELPVEDPDGGPEGDSWIIKWKQEADPAFQSLSEVLSEDVTFRISVARPAAGKLDRGQWVQLWQSSPYVDYIQENQAVEVMALSNDPLVGEQKYLKQIHAEEAWDEAKVNPNLIIALVDTGVDLKHPDLKDNLTKGINLIDKKKTAQDDNGHGTNVAGVLAAAGNNNLGITGLVWNTNIMPIKALEASGRGDEDKLGAGIRYAVDHGAKIIVLSVGLYRYSPYMEEVVNYAEQHDVLLISATGNDGKDVKYPAGYPTVVAVGGATPLNKVDPHSNYGPEVDIVAPWNVYTTALGGGYARNEGTSMAAPQVAAAAALIWSKYSEMKPYQIRSLLRQTADDIEVKGWDPYTGYGLLRIDRALKEVYKEDIYENNDRRDLAKPLPVDSMITADFSSGTDHDWFVLNSPYNGKVVIQLVSNDTTEEEIQLTYSSPAQAAGKLYSNRPVQTIQFQVSKGLGFIKLNLVNSKLDKPFKYKMTIKFNMNPDDFEDNDREFKAFAMTARNQTIKGTFHQINDQDWFMLAVTNPGTVRLKLTSNTLRMDLALIIQKKGQESQLIDLGDEGETEYSPLIDVAPGDFYIGIHNAVSSNAPPVTGEYTLNITYNTKYTDPNEPNNKSYQASSVVIDAVYTGVIDKIEDEDWFSFSINSESLVNFTLSHIPLDRVMSLTLNNYTQKRISIDVNKVGESTLKLQRVLAKGTYFVRMSANQAFEHQLYKFMVAADILIAGYIDIAGHWAQASIVNLTNNKVISGYENYLFRPNKSVTRAEAAVMLVKAFNFTEAKGNEFSDVAPNHWAYSFIDKARSAGVISGYTNGTFKPDQPVSRVEMASMLANALKLKGTAGNLAPFPDISPTHWAAKVLRRMKAERYISGYADGSFRPESLATRAEMAEIISKAIRRPS
ncbi:MAG TPA: S8 family serine peptidase [Bacilli bacterium]